MPLCSVKFAIKCSCNRVACDPVESVGHQQSDFCYHLEKWVRASVSGLPGHSPGFDSHTLQLGSTGMRFSRLLCTVSSQVHLNCNA